MTKQIVQIENANAIEFKNEILAGVLKIIKDHATSLQQDDKDLLLSRQETANLLSVSLSTLWDWTRKDVLPAYRIGYKVRYKKSEVIQALKKMNKFNKDDE
jgi:excisionase family DNA binding protein